MKERNNDTSYMDISDVINKNFKPINIIPPEIGMKIMDDLKITDEMDTIITGSFDEWSVLVSFILDRYILHVEEDDNLGEINLTQLEPNFYDECGILTDYVGRIMKLNSKDGEIPKMINIKGELPQISRFYEMVKEYERQKTKFNDNSLAYE